MPIFVTAETANNLVPVREVAGGVPVKVFDDPADSPNNCVPVRIAEEGEIAVPIVVIEGALPE
ncbi:hypothetical protein D3C83_279400 [compost metagenome]